MTEIVVLGLVACGAAVGSIVALLRAARLPEVVGRWLERASRDEGDAMKGMR